ncbi:hypothetical protein Cpir12675_003302 [Ceratocystis pirilliformis]|uniref:C2H2-type domain-containing protein n=1 Tax=Ceratocystis pirilliformis TaxID=259994 RepID=A0ABR3Z3Y8_9PEZI
MCVLCRDTFSRSDILKRHFQKCSIRRGNPTGVGHLSHPQAHVKKNQQKQAALAEAGDMSHLNGLSAIQDGNVLAAAAAGTRSSFEPSYTADVSVTMPGQPLANYSMSTQAGGLPMYGSNSTPTTQQSGLDWAQMFQPGA